MKLAQVNEALEHRITGGSYFGWNCWDNAHYIDYESDFAYAGIVFNNKTQEVYSAEINVRPNAWPDSSKEHAPYRWMNPAYREPHAAEALERGVNPNEAWDKVEWTDLDVAEDWLEKAKSIFNGEDYDDRIQVEVTFSDEELLTYMTAAHKLDLSFNEFVERALHSMIEERKNDISS